MTDIDSTAVRHSAAGFLDGGGEMGALMRAKDWTRTPLGDPARWPAPLQTAARIMLTSRQPMFVWWGEELINLYNDAYLSIIGGKHPEALGQGAAKVWREIWEQVGRRAESAMRYNEGTYDEALRLIMERNGYPEETYYTFSYSPIPGEHGGAGGIICANTDDTQRIIGTRQLALLRDLAARLAGAPTIADVCARSMDALWADPYDLTFALLYLITPESPQTLVLAGRCGVPDGHPLAVEQLAADSGAPWPIAQVLHTRTLQLIDLPPAAADIPSGVWPRSARHAVAAPIALGNSGHGAILVAGLNPYRLFDDSYRGFIDLVGAQIAAGFAHAQAYAEEHNRAQALAQLDKAKTTFFSNVSHEFRTPLTLILGPIDEVLSKPGALSQDDRQLLDVACRNGRRLRKLVTTLLDFSRIEAGRIQALYQPLDLSARTADLASMFRASVEKAGLRYHIDCQSLPEAVFVDPDMWEKIVLNLISNAFKYTLAGDITIALRAENACTVLRVIDTGVGIAAAELPNIFNRFHRVAETQGRSHEGTGIGLALVQELVKLHGGKVEVESSLGDGTTFTVTLPFGHAHLPADHVSTTPAPNASSHAHAPVVEELLGWMPDQAYVDDDAPILASTGARATVVLADDNIDMRSYVRRLLADHYEVVAVGDGREALQAVAEHHPDLVITDVMMPQLDGFGVLKALRADPTTASIPVIILSARAGEEARVEGLEAGADDYLSKPFSARELLARVAGTLALARQRREAMHREEELKAETINVLESIAEGFIAVDSEFRLTYVNAEAERIYGAPRRELLGRHCREVFPDLIEGATEAEYHEAMVQRTHIKFERFVHTARRWFDVDCYPARDGGLAIYFRDITERKVTVDALKEAARRKDEFLATLAHELRNPLAPIRSGLQIMRLAGGDRATEDQARRIVERQFQQMVRLVDDLFDLSRISRGAIQLRKEPVELASVIQSAVETSQPLIDLADQTLVVHLPAKPLLIDADTTRLAQVFSNLLNNASKFTEKGGRISLAAVAQDDAVVVSVKDNGMGIPTAMLPQVFEMFTQVERSLERSRGGLGIGLNIVKQLVNMHGGSVEAHSDGEGRGSEFRVHLPLLAENTVLAPAPSDHQQSQVRQRRVLIADDNPDSADGLALLLKIRGNDVRTVNDGLSVLELAESFRPEVILLDIGMPKLNGYEVCRCIRERDWGSDPAIIALTGWGQDEDRRRSQEAGFDHHLVKPVELSVLEPLLDSGRTRTTAPPVRAPSA